MTAAAERNREHYDQATAEHAVAVDAAATQRDAWLDEHAGRATFLLAAEQDALAEQRIDLRDAIADRLTGSDTLLERDSQAQAIAREAHPDLAPEPPTVDINPGLDLGP